MDTNPAHPSVLFPRQPAVLWKDLVYLSPMERLWELTLPLPWLLLSLFLYQGQWFAWGMIPSFYFFLTGLRLSHQSQHYSLSIPRWLHDGVLFCLSVLMFTSMHAVQVSHLHHHRRCLEQDDNEGAWAKYPWWIAIAMGPLFVARLHLLAYAQASKLKKRWILLEILAIAVTIAVLWTAEGMAGLKLHAAAMLFGECMTGFFAVWTVHHHCDKEEISRTQRGTWSNLIFYGMFLHKEHHVYPQVPTAHLPILAQRLDARSKSFAARQVLPGCR